LTVPLQAVDRQGEHALVLVVDSSNKIQSRQIELGIEGDSEAEVLSGLREGDQVVISDKSGLKTGEQVRPQLTSAATYQPKG
jgi:membrane fusion protein, macrolide-specific efflux system